MDLSTELFGRVFQNPVLLASGTCGYGRELDGLLDLDTLGGLVTKAVTPEPRDGNPSPRVAELDGGMLNSVGLANVGLEAFVRDKLPWLERRLQRAHVLINVAGRTVEDYVQVIEALEQRSGFLGFELNVSCPNVKEGGAAFASREDLLAGVVRRARAATRRALIVKLAPNVPDISRMAQVAEAEGADGLTLINTIPGLLFDVDTRAPRLGAGAGGLSGPALLPVGVHAVWQASRRVSIPLIGLGGIRSGEDAVQYFLAGASLVQLGTVNFADPRAAGRVLKQLARYGERHRMAGLSDLIGTGASR
jgi:dihydroorotate dehydrogenase (NAD+) catalytic subunit